MAEHTPNPEAIRFSAGSPLLPEGSAEFADRESAEAGSPLASRLFRLEGVRRVFIGSDFLTVTKAPEADWRALGPAVQAALREHFSAGSSVLAPGYRRSPATSSGAGSRIRQILEEEIRPAVARDGGEVLFVDYRDGVLRLEMRGACAGCPSATQTLREGIEARLRREIPELVRVLAQPDPLGND